MVLELKITHNIALLTFTRPLTALACHGIRMFVRFWPTLFLETSVQ